MMRGIELNKETFLDIEAKITKLLKQDKEFTSEKYSGLDIPTINDKWILLEPKQEWLLLIESLGLNFTNFNESIIKQV